MMVSKKKVPEIWKDEIKKGYKAAMDTVAKHDGTKGYFLGRRVHHGLVGGGLFYYKIIKPMSENQAFQLNNVSLIYL